MPLGRDAFPTTNIPQSRVQTLLNFVTLSIPRLINRVLKTSLGRRACWLVDRVRVWLRGACLPVRVRVCVCVCVCVCVFVSHNSFPRVARSNRAYEHNMAAIVVSAGLCALVSTTPIHSSWETWFLFFFFFDNHVICKCQSLQFNRHCRASATTGSCPCS